MITHCTLIKPRASSPMPMRVVYSTIVSTSAAVRWMPGYTAIESPEWTPARSMCSMMPGMST